MLRRAKNGKRLKLIGCLTVAAVALLAATAFAADTITANQDTSSFTGSNFNSNQGELVSFQVTGGIGHNATATGSGPDGKALFRSATISGGTTPVNGTQYLTTGNYSFICTIHPSMHATLHVSGSGTPVPRPSAVLTVRSKKLAKVAKKGNLQVGVNMTAPVDGASLTATLGKATIGRINSVSLASGQQSEVIKLSKSGKSKLAAKAKATVTVSAEIPFGSAATAKGKLK